MDWEVRSLHADLIDADKILARQIGDVDNRVDQVYAEVIDTRELIADEVRAREADIRELRADILEVENAIIKRAEIESIVSSKISTSTLSANQIILEGYRCGRVNVMKNAYVLTSKGDVVTNVTLKISNGLVKQYSVSKGEAVTAAALGNQTEARVVGI